MLSVDNSEKNEKAITGFRSWLISQDKTKVTVKNTVNYAKRFSHVLDTGDASPLLTLSPRNKHHAMSALANYAKYTGRYDQFLQLRQRYNLRWSKGGSLQYFERFFHNKELSFEAMLSKVNQMVKILYIENLFILSKPISRPCLPRRTFYIMQQLRQLQ
jgi:hypothetical protein